MLSEEERNQLAGEGLRRIAEILDGVPDLRNGVPLPPDAAAEIELIFARGRIVGILSDNSDDGPR